MRWTVRRACVHDATELARVTVISWRRAYRGIMDAGYLDGMDIGTHTARWRDRLLRGTETDAVFVAENPLATEKRIAAYCQVRSFLDNQDHAGVGQVVALYADPATWGCGAGRAVHRAGIDHLAARGLEEALLWVAEANERARSFYASEGWRYDSHDPSGHDQHHLASADMPIPIIRYQRTLARPV